MTERVRITDVSPRDGLQNEPGVIPTADKLRLIQLLCETGVDEVEVTSFVSPKWVPQLADSEEVLRRLSEWIRGVTRVPPPPQRPVFSALVPNKFGMQPMLSQMIDQDELTIEKAAVFTAASETFSKRNTNASIAETLDRFAPLIEKAHHPAQGIMIRGYISCAIACPFEGPIAPHRVAEVARSLVDIGVDEIDLGDTIGAGTPQTVAAMLEVVRVELGDAWWNAEKMTLHLHDTFGRAAECVRTALDLGVRSFDGSVAGLGGCPYASTPGKRAPGNISTALLVSTVEQAGYKTRVDHAKLDEAAQFAAGIVAKSRMNAAAGEGTGP